MNSLLFLDLETTGLKPESAEIIEISAVRLSPDLKTETALFDSLVFPENGISLLSQKITGIREEDLQNAPKCEEIGKKFSAFLSPDDIICGHNISFDIGFLNHYGIEVTNDSIDTFPLANILLRNEPSYALEILTTRYGILHADAHRALSDVRANIDLFRLFRHTAAALPSDLRALYAPFLEKTSWAGKCVFEDLDSVDFSFSATDVPAKKKSNPVSSTSLSAVNTLWNQNERSVCAVPMTMDFFSLATEAAREKQKQTGESVAVALPSLSRTEIPNGFFSFAPPEKIFCETAFSEWNAARTQLNAFEVVAAMKFVRERYFHHSLRVSDLPLVWEERDVAKNWIRDAHTNCEKTCPGKVYADEASRHSLLLCEIADIPAVPAEHFLVLDAHFLADHLDKTARRKRNFFSFEKALRKKEGHPVARELLSLLENLKKYIRGRVGGGPYSKNFVFSDGLLRGEEMNLFLQNFSRAQKDMTKEWPLETELLDALDFLIAFLTPSNNENECRFMSIYADENIIAQRTAISLSDQFSAFFDAPKSVLFMGHSFLRHNGALSLGQQLVTPSAQEEIPSSFDFAQKARLILPEANGNTKSDSHEKTLAVAGEMPPDLSENILVLFPNQSMAERASAQWEAERDISERSAILCYGSRGKIRAQMEKGPVIIFCAHSALNKIDFSVANISVCVQHRLFFDPPSDPVQKVRHTHVFNEFLEVALPKAAQKMRLIFDRLSLRGDAFVWACLDEHLHKKKDIERVCLAALPKEMPVERRRM